MMDYWEVLAKGDREKSYHKTSNSNDLRPANGGTNQKKVSHANRSITSGTRMFINSLARDRYPVNYIYGFSSGGFSYFLTTQKRDQSSPFHSRLVRVCQNDPDYYSYTEVPIECAGYFHYID